MNLLFHHIQGTEWIFGICRNIFQGIQGFVVNELLVGINLSIDNRITFRLRLGYLLDAHTIRNAMIAAAAAEVPKYLSHLLRGASSFSISFSSSFRI